MHLDLRYPIGLLLTTYGAILAFEGAMFQATVLGLNVNLYWGAVMIGCGLGAIYLARRTHKAQVTSHKAQGTSHKTHVTDNTSQKHDVTGPVQ